MTTPNPPATEGPVKAPHAPLTDYYASEAERSKFLQDVFDDTGVDYDRIERVLAWGTGAWYRREALKRAGLTQGMRVVDVGFGTGLVAVEAIALVGSPDLIIGIDPSQGMIKASPLLGQVQVLEGRAEKIPLPDNSCDFLSMGYALRHISDLGQAFSEFNRVLKPGGRLCLLEISKPQSAWGTFLLKLYMRVYVPIIARFVSKSKNTSMLWRYYWDSIEACANPQQIMASLSQAGLQQVGRHLELGIFSEYQAVKAGGASSTASTSA